jgi:predicted branched-subunit amino acid permease
MLPEDSAWKQFALGAAAISPVCVAALPIGVVWGALAIERGLGTFEIGLMTWDRSRPRSGSLPSRD